MVVTAFSKARAAAAAAAKPATRSGKTWVAVPSLGVERDSGRGVAWLHRCVKCIYLASVFLNGGQEAPLAPSISGIDDPFSANMHCSAGMHGLLIDLA